MQNFFSESNEFYADPTQPCMPFPEGWLAWEGDLRGVRERVFMLFHLGVSFLALSLLPVFWVMRVQLSLLETLGFIWFLSPLAIAISLFSSGSYKVSGLLSAGNFVGALAFWALLSGASLSLLVPWLIVALFFAMFASGFRLTLSIALIAAVSMFLLLLANAAREAGFFPPRIEGVSLLATLPSVLAFFSSTGIVMGAVLHQRLEHTAFQGMRENMGLIIDEAADLLTRHSLDGRVVYASAAASRLFGMPAAALWGDGMFGRVHPADRSRFLRAIAQASLSHHSVKVVYRVQCGVAGLEGGLSPGPFVWVGSLCRRSGQRKHDIRPSSRDVIVVTRRSHARESSHQMSQGQIVEKGGKAISREPSFNVKERQESPSPLGFNKRVEKGAGLPGHGQLVRGEERLRFSKFEEERERLMNDVRLAVVNGSRYGRDESEGAGSHDAGAARLVG